MTHYNTHTKGIAPLAIVLIVSAVLAVGGGTYYASTKQSAEVKVVTEENQQATSTATDTEKDTRLSLRSLIGVGKDVQCTFTKLDGNISTKGVVYISDNDLRGDFNTTVDASTFDSHMIKMGDDMYVWSSAQGNQGIKMKATADMKAQENQAVNIDEQLDYTCADWNKDEAKFTLPQTVQFIELNAVMQGNIQGSMNSAAGSGSAEQNQCAMCALITDPAAQAQCKLSLSCK